MQRLRLPYGGNSASGFATMSHACDGRPDVNIDDLTGIVFSRLSSLGIDGAA